MGSVAIQESLANRYPWDHWAPEAPLMVSQWAEENRILTPKYSNFFGPWRNDFMPYLIEPMDAICLPHVEEITLQWSAQTGKTEVILNCLGWVLEYYEDPTMYVLPRNEDITGQNPYIQRIHDFVVDTPALLAHTTGREDHLAGKLWKFKNLYLKFAGSNSPADLASTANRFIFGDELNKWPQFSGREADPLSLAKVRTITYGEDFRLIKASTPVLKSGLITKEYLASDQRTYRVPCPACGYYQELGFSSAYNPGLGQIRWPEGADPEDIRKNWLAWYECGKCHRRINEDQKSKMIAGGVWCPAKCEVDSKGRIVGESPIKSRRGYHISAIYSPLVSWSRIAAEFLEAKDDSAKLMSFVNSTLGQPFEDLVPVATAHELISRREEYKARVPKGVMLLGAGVDIQKDRIEAVVLGWARGDECWIIEHKVFPGFPSDKPVWNDLDRYLLGSFRHEEGFDINLSIVGLDTGDQTQEAYEFCKPRWARSKARVVALKGARQEDSRTLVDNGRRLKRENLVLYMVGTRLAKKTIYRRLKLANPGPGYFHFPMDCEDEFFDQLTAEKVKPKIERGFEREYWYKTRRNEVLDCVVYGLAALYILKPNWAAIERSFERYRAIGDKENSAFPQPEVRGRRVRSKGIDG